MTSIELPLGENTKLRTTFLIAQILKTDDDDDDDEAGPFIQTLPSQNG